MRLTTCITTRNDPERLDKCLQAIWNSNIKPYSAIVSDDSPESEMQDKNRQIVENYPGTTYLKGPQRGVNANRNCAVNSVKDTDLIAFVDDDICLDPDFIENALKKYEQMSPEERERTFITGDSRDVRGIKVARQNFRFAVITRQLRVPVNASIFMQQFFPESFFMKNNGKRTYFLVKEMPFFVCVL